MLFTFHWNLVISDRSASSVFRGCSEYASYSALMWQWCYCLNNCVHVLQLAKEAEGCRELRVESSLLFMSRHVFPPSVAVFSSLLSSLALANGLPSSFLSHSLLFLTFSLSLSLSKPLSVSLFEGLSFSETAFPFLSINQPICLHLL